MPGLLSHENSYEILLLVILEVFFFLLFIVFIYIRLIITQIEEFLVHIKGKYSFYYE